MVARAGSERASFRGFVDREVVPLARRIDEEETVPSELVAKVRAAGYLGASLPVVHGGLGLDMVTTGRLHEEMGRGCSSMRSLLTVHGMMGHVLERWGTDEQRSEWLPRLARGEKLAAFALTEPGAGSDAKSVETRAVEVADGFALTGAKRWVTFGLAADVLLVFARTDGGPAAFLVECDRSGIRRTPVRGLLGTRGAMTASIDFEGCVVPRKNLVSKIGVGISHVASTALAFGRYSVACGGVGIAQACLEASVAHASGRVQFGVPIAQHQLVRQMLSDMLTQVRAARLLCEDAGARKDANDPRWIEQTFVAKYFASQVAMRAATDAVQIHGALGCSPELPVSRMFRDAKVLEIIEGSTQIQQITIAEFALTGGDEP